MTLGVPFVNLGAQQAALGEALGAAVARVLVSSRYILGPEVEALEASIAERLKVRHAVGVASGTDALVVSLLAAGVRPGDEVVTSAFSFIATVESILRVSAVPRLVDVDAESLNLRVDEVERALGDRTRAILPVHLFGVPAEMEALSGLARRRGVAVVEDAAQAFGSTHRHRAAGTWGDLGCFSFFPTKVLGAVGDAGLVVTNDGALAERCRSLRQHGLEGQGEYGTLGGNHRMDAIQAAVLSVKLGAVDAWISRRREIARSYDAAFAGLEGLRFLTRGEPGEWNGALYTVRVQGGRRDAFRKHLDSRSVETAVYYARPLHLQPLLAPLEVRRGSLPESERAALEVVSLPLYPELTPEQRECVVRSVQSFFT